MHEPTTATDLAERRRNRSIANLGEDKPRRIRGSASITKDNKSRSLLTDMIVDLAKDPDVGGEDNRGAFVDQPIFYVSNRKDPLVTNKDQYKLGRESQRETRFPPTKSPTMVPSESPSISPTLEEDKKNYFKQFDRPIKVACAGGSLTRGEAGGNPRSFSYPNQLQEMLGEGFEVFNFGRSGATAVRDLPTSFVDQEQFQWSIDKEPDIYLLMLGTTDSKYWSTHGGQAWREDFKQVVNAVNFKLRESPPRIIVAIPPWVNAANFDGINNQIVVSQIHPLILSVSVAKGVQVVDMYSVTVGRQELFVSNNVHLNRDGYRVLAENWKRAIQCNRNGVCNIGENCGSCPEDCFMNCPPSESPSSSPTMEEDKKNYFKQFDRPIKVACAGGSLTRGEAGGNLRVFSYPNQLQAMLGEDFEVFNFGRTGATAISELSSSYVDKIQFQWSIDKEPDIYLLMLGTTDSKHWSMFAQNFRTNLKEIVNAVNSRLSESLPRIILAVPPWVKTDNFGITNAVLRDDIQPLIESVARAKDLQVVNMYSVTVNQQDFFVSDGVHLNEDGYRTLAQNWKLAIECNQNGICEIGESCDACPQDCTINCPKQLW